MASPNNFEYYVVQFLDLPYKDIDEHVCIPSSWIVVRRDRNVVVTYPVENPSSTAKRVAKRERFSEEWNFYRCIQKYGTDVYEDAKIFIKRYAKANGGSDKHLNLVASSKRDAKKTLKRTARPNSVIEPAPKRSKVQFAESVSEVVEEPCRKVKAYECTNDNQSSPAREDFQVKYSCILI